MESRQANVLEQGFVGVPDNCADLVFLDLPCPEKCLNEVLRVSKNYAYFCVFLPCIEQCHQLIKAMFDSSVNIDKEKQSNFYSVQTIKATYIAYEYDQRTLGTLNTVAGCKNICDFKKITHLRKVQMGRTHTGYLIFSRVNKGQ